MVELGVHERDVETLVVQQLRQLQHRVYVALGRVRDADGVGFLPERTHPQRLSFTTPDRLKYGLRDRSPT